MRANAWRRFLDEQRQRRGKVLFTVTELANVSGASRAVLNVELTRLREQEIIARYAHGLYGMPGAVSPEVLVPAIDGHAYITGHYALYRHRLVTQVPVAITCFTDRRSPRAQERITPVGRLIFVCVRSRVYSSPPEGSIAPPIQALCDYVFLSRRHRAVPEALVTFRNLARLQVADFRHTLARYPITVRKHVERLVRETERNWDAASFSSSPSILAATQFRPSLETSSHPTYRNPGASLSCPPGFPSMKETCS